MTQPIAAKSFRSKAADAETLGRISALLLEAAAETKAGNHYKAGSIFLRILEADPRQPSALGGLAAALRRQGNMAASGEAYEKAIAMHPGIAGLYFGFAEVLRRRGRYSEALDACDRGFALDPAVSEGHITRSEIWKDLGDGDKAIADIEAVTRINPTLGAIRLLLADTLAKFGRISDAIASLEHALEIIPGDPSLLAALYKILTAQGLFEKAVPVWETIATARPDDAEAQRSLATLYQEQGRIQDAFDAYQKALAIDPKFIRAYVNLAALMNADNRFDLATAIYSFIVALTPDDGAAHHNLARSLRLEGKWAESAVINKRALTLDPDLVQAHVEALIIHQYTCNWKGLRDKLRDLERFQGRVDLPIPPFTYVCAPGTTPGMQLGAAKVWAQYKKNRVFLNKPVEHKPVEAAGNRIKIGYVSSDFHSHATAMLIVEMIEKHDRDRFEVFAYSFGPDDGSGLRERCVRAFDHFRELRAISNSEATRRIQADGIDILVDLKGYTLDSRTEIFAARPAPLQINYLGYPSTMGADFMDYIIADRIVLPMSNAPFYSEKIVHLPHSYQPNDRKRPIAHSNATRATYGLPEDGFVFCCFNNPYKILDFMFDTWMEILHEVPGSVLWLFSTAEKASENLQLHCASRGVDPSRLKFTPHKTNDVHLARMKLADLFLDTLPYNAHTTASDALWAGVPVLTCMGDSFAGRVAASLLHAIDVPDLITDSLETYKAKALELARNPAALASLRDRLEANRLTTPLYDSSLYTANYEAALIAMFERYRAGLEPEAIATSVSW